MKTAIEAGRVRVMELVSRAYHRIDYDLRSSFENGDLAVQFTGGTFFDYCGSRYLIWSARHCESSFKLLALPTYTDDGLHSTRRVATRACT